MDEAGDTLSELDIAQIGKTDISEKHTEQEANSPKRPETHASEFDTKAEQLTDDFEALSEAVALQERSIITAEIDSLKDSGAKPYKVFVRIAGECTRADNIFCGINGEAAHEVLSSYLREQATLAEGDSKEVVEWLALREERLASHRRLVKEFLILDQLTDASNYQEGRVVDENTPYFNSSLSWYGEAGISERVLPDRVKIAMSDKIRESKQTIDGWEKERETVFTLGQEVSDLIIANNPQASSELVERGSAEDDTEYWLNDIQTPENWEDPALEVLEATDIPEDKAGTALTKFMEGLTGAEAVLEHQQYYVGVGLLRAAASGTLSEKAKEIIKKDLQDSATKSQLSEKTN